MAKRTIKAWLRKYHFSDKPCFVATIASGGKVTVADIIEELKKEGMELNPATVLDVITRFNNMCISMLAQGQHVNNGLVHMHPSIKGLFFGKIWNSDTNSIYISISQGKELREAIAETKVEILGEHPDPTSIFTLTDLSTGMTDASVTRKFNAEVKGTYIKVVGDDPTCGIYFSNEDWQIDYKLPNEYIVINDPSRVLILIPETLEPNTYEMRIVTQYAASNRPLKKPRSIVYQLPVTVL
jgi:hypothetical protein